MKLLLILSALLFVRSTTADNVISTKSCYVFNENFMVTFTDNTPRSGDVVQIVASGTTKSLLSQSTCASFFFGICFFPPKSGSLVFQERLAAGNYQALLRRSGTSGTILATSVAFRLVASGQRCNAVTPSPTRAPTLSPLPPTPPTINDAANDVLTKARGVIAGLVQADPRLTPEFIRMGFHDCISVCDGCIDMTVADNNGLAHPISVLQPVVAQFENATVGVSRADIWALAAMVGADVSPHGTITQPISFTNNWFGRVNCEKANTVCKNKQGATVACSPTVGPARNMPSVNFDGPSLFKYFTTEYNLTQRQVVALMGAHTVGRLLKTESGIDGPNGWQVNNAILHHEYYNALLGGATASTPLSQVESQSPNWVRVVDNNAGTSFPNVNRWALGVTSPPLVMLNPDVSLVRDLNPTNTNPTTGSVSCAFNAAAETGTAPCNVASTFNIAAQFSDNNDLWLSEFKAAMDLMLTNGYNRNACAKPVCQLTPK